MKRMTAALTIAAVVLAAGPAGAHQEFELLVDFDSGEPRQQETFGHSQRGFSCA